MPLDPTKPAADLDVTQTELSAREKQNRFGLRHTSIQDIGDDGFLSILVVKTPEKFTPEQWGLILNHLVENYSVSAMQALFELNIPQPDEGCQNNLYVSAHLRMDNAPILESPIEP